LTIIPKAHKSFGQVSSKKTKVQNMSGTIVMSYLFKKVFTIYGFGKSGLEAN